MVVLCVHFKDVLM